MYYPESFSRRTNNEPFSEPLRDLASLDGRMNFDKIERELTTKSTQRYHAARRYVYHYM